MTGQGRKFTKKGLISFTKILENTFPGERHAARYDTYTIRQLESDAWTS